MRRKPKYLPQVSAPFEYVLKHFDRDGVMYKDITFSPNDLLPSQHITFTDTIKVDDSKKKEPIWVAGKDDDENVIIDGHHRWVDSISKGEPINTIKIFEPPNNAMRILNKVQDIHEYQNGVELEEVITHTQNINNRQDTDDWLGVIFEEAKDINKDKELEPKKMVGYRDRPVNENSLIGNFFSLNKLPECDKYEIEFENLLDTNELGIEYKTDQKPTEVIAMLWFPNVNFNGLSEKHQISVDNLKNKAIAEYAKKMGYDGIKYGDVMVQGF